MTGSSFCNTNLAIAAVLARADISQVQEHGARNAECLDNYKSLYNNEYTTQIIRMEDCYAAESENYKENGYGCLV